MVIPRGPRRAHLPAGPGRELASPGGRPSAPRAPVASSSDRQRCLRAPRRRWPGGTATAGGRSSCGSAADVPRPPTVSPPRPQAGSPAIGQTSASSARIRANPSPRPSPSPSPNPCPAPRGCARARPARASEAGNTHAWPAAVWGRPTGAPHSRPLRISCSGADSRAGPSRSATHPSTSASTHPLSPARPKPQPLRPRPDLLHAPLPGLPLFPARQHLGHASVPGLPVLLLAAGPRGRKQRRGGGGRVRGRRVSRSHARARAPHLGHLQAAPLPVALCASRSHLPLSSPPCLSRAPDGAAADRSRSATGRGAPHRRALHTPGTPDAHASTSASTSTSVRSSPSASAARTRARQHPSGAAAAAPPELSMKSIAEHCRVFRPPQGRWGGGGPTAVADRGVCSG